MANGNRMAHGWLGSIAAICLLWPAIHTLDAAPSLRYGASTGVVVETTIGTLTLDRDDSREAIVLRFPRAGEERLLRDVHVQESSPSSLQLTYRVGVPGGGDLAIVRKIELRPHGQGTVLHEAFEMVPSVPLKTDLEIERPFTWLPALAEEGWPVRATLPLKNGQAKVLELASGEVRGEYRLGNTLTDAQTPILGLPTVQIHTNTTRFAVCADPTFSALCSLRRSGQSRSGVQGSVRYRYAGARVPILGKETRYFGFWFAGGDVSKQTFERGVDAFFALMLPDVPAGPKWLHKVAMISYDFLSDNGQGWEKDIRVLTPLLTPEERGRVALCLHGWYDALGAYAYDDTAGRMKDRWVAFARTRKVAFTRDELRRRLRLARDAGFRVLLYFADGLAADSGVPGYRDDWAYRDDRGQKIEGWQGPDTFGKTYLRNPAHPEVSRWYGSYLKALLETYGRDVDGVVWDETFHMSVGRWTPQPKPAYCDRAMLSLVKALTAQVERYDPNKVFLSSDCIGALGAMEIPGYAMMADGTYQDSHCTPAAWSYGLFPNWRNTLWSCNWNACTWFHCTRWGVQTFGVPVVFTNGWEDDRGPSELTVVERDRLLALFRDRLKRTSRLRFLTQGPERLLAGSPDRPAPGDPLPTLPVNCSNWALAAHGAKVTASSEDMAVGRFPADGVIDGVRDDTGWGSGHGWASKAGEPLPQWLEIDFGRTRSVSEFAVITYQRENSPETAGKWGVTRYRIEAWDGGARAWRTVVTESSGRAVKVRVHRLVGPLRAEKVRIVVEDVVPLDGQARLLQFEAWGPAAY